MHKQLETWSLFRKTFAKLQRIAEDDLRKYGTTPSQFSILWNLSVEESTPMSELSKQSACVNSNITSIIGRMEERGLVKRIQDRKDRRVVRVELTEEGKKLYNQTVAQHKEFLVKMLECYTEEELEILNKLLDKVYEHVG
ncbi:MAG: MarR family transcriptional regulator, organic hydroperoxide resistance regulator [Clostridia bacterium]|nr:MarR family transcriptional regulator, organic hydroperoxide resistance regulator [Clostridia bacterium]MDN5322981.1 MarR family transcriptional regulator, organic hydroperoxide resistance regulator [Clostridia bacterium]